MTTDNSILEHFCTLFDKNYLPLGLALHKSLMIHAGLFHLWIVCMDEQVEHQLKHLDLPNVSLIPLKDIETPELLAVKPSRSRGEYCWTMTSFTFQAVFTRDSMVQQVTYLDADLFFFNNPRILLHEMAIDKHVLITEHAYAPEYDQSKISGIFCVQFLTIKQTPEGLEVVKWWQARCLEWCFNRVEGDKFGDQKYLDHWPHIFGNRVHIVHQREKTLAPWNVSYFNQTNKNILNPVFFHFHGLRLTAPRTIQLYHKYRICQQGQILYEGYIETLTEIIYNLKKSGVPIPFFSQNYSLFSFFKTIKWILFGETKFRTIPMNLDVATEAKH
jgi:hypothetical protein